MRCPLKIRQNNSDIYPKMKHVVRKTYNNRTSSVYNWGKIIKKTHFFNKNPIPYYFLYFILH